MTKSSSISLDLSSVVLLLIHLLLVRLILRRLVSAFDRLFLTLFPRSRTNEEGEEDEQDICDVPTPIQAVPRTDGGGKVDEMKRRGNIQQAKVREKEGKEFRILCKSQNTAW